MRKLKKILLSLNDKSIIEKYKITEIKLLCYAHYQIKEGFVPAFVTTSLLYPNKEVHVERYQEISKIENADKCISWYFSFLVECFGQNLSELKSYLEGNFKGLFKCVSVYRLFDDTEKLVVESNVGVKKLNYF